MAAPIYTAQDIQSALIALLPQGRVWPKELDTTQAETFGAIAQTFKRECDAGNALLVDAFPATTEFLLPEWEATLGLPDPCTAGAETIAQRVAQVVSKLSKPGGQSIAYFVSLAGALGYPNATVTQYAPFRVGRSRMGAPLGGAGWMFVWTLTAPTLPVTYFRTGLGRMGDPLYSLAADGLRCTIEAAAPAHTNVLFSGYA